MGVPGTAFAGVEQVENGRTALEVKKFGGMIRLLLKNAQWDEVYCAGSRQFPK